MTQYGQQVGWLVNDCLTTIQGTKTFWHDLLEWFPGLENKTGGYTKFELLADKVEKEAILNSPPDYIIRNATFFRPLRIRTKQIVFLQDHYEDLQRLAQLEVCNSADVVVFNSNFICDIYKAYIHKPYHIIPIGVDFNFFTPSDSMKEYDIIYVGDSSINPKGFDIIERLIKRTKYKFALVMKDNFSIEHKRVKVFNKISHNALRYILRRSKILLCTSRIETLHLAGVEAMACGIPVVTTSVGIYKNFSMGGSWGMKINPELYNDFTETLEYVIDNSDFFKPRQFALENELDKLSCKRKWLNLVKEVMQ